MKKLVKLEHEEWRIEWREKTAEKPVSFVFLLAQFCFIVSRYPGWANETDFQTDRVEDLIQAC